MTQTTIQGDSRKRGDTSYYKHVWFQVNIVNEQSSHMLIHASSAGREMIYKHE